MQETSRKEKDEQNQNQKEVCLQAGGPLREASQEPLQRKEPHRSLASKEPRQQPAASGQSGETNTNEQNLTTAEQKDSAEIQRHFFDEYMSLNGPSLRSSQPLRNLVLGGQPGPGPRSAEPTTGHQPRE